MCWNEIETMKYKLHCHITISAYCEVEAESEAEAIKKSGELTPAMHFNGSGKNAQDHWLVDEIDGEPQEITVSA